MKIRTVIYVLMIITGILIERYGLKTDNYLQHLFSGTVISLGILNIVVDYLKKK